MYSHVIGCISLVPVKRNYEFNITLKQILGYLDPIVQGH